MNRYRLIRLSAIFAYTAGIIGLLLASQYPLLSYSCIALGFIFICVDESSIREMDRRFEKWQKKKLESWA